ncbi:hypothetical protein MTO96_032336 [Rhipicephalus appendiculatus]
MVPQFFGLHLPQVYLILTQLKKAGISPAVFILERYDLDTPNEIRFYDDNTGRYVYCAAGVQLRAPRCGCFRGPGVRLRDRKRLRLGVLDLERGLPAGSVVAAASAYSAALASFPLPLRDM